MPVTYPLYRHPQWYDTAASWDISRQIGILERIWGHWGPGEETHHILEPATGTGRYALALARRGYDVLGYDISRDMLDYARSITEQETNLRGQVRWAQMEMTTANTGRGCFDAGFIMANSLGYLLDYADVLTHLRTVSTSLVDGGVYIIHMQLAAHFPPLNASSWSQALGDTRVTTSWLITDEDIPNRRCMHRCRMLIEKNGQRTRFDDDHELRLWMLADMQSAAEDSGFNLVAGVTETGQILEFDHPVTGESGLIYFVLKKPG